MSRSYAPAVIFLLSVTFVVFVPCFVKFLGGFPPTFCEEGGFLSIDLRHLNVILEKINTPAPLSMVGGFVELLQV